MSAEGLSEEAMSLLLDVRKKGTSKSLEIVQEKVK